MKDSKLDQTLESVCVPQAAAQEEATRPPEVDEMVALHSVVLVQQKGHLRELDGRKLFDMHSTL